MVVLFKELGKKYTYGVLILPFFEWMLLLLSLEDDKGVKGYVSTWHRDELGKEIKE